MQQIGSHHQYATADLSKEEDIQRISQDIHSHHYDVFINNAGIGVNGRFEKENEAKLTEMIEVNCIAAMRLAHVYLKTAQQGDALLNTSSVMGLLQGPYTAVYTGTKAFLTALSEALWFEQKHKGIYVTALLPGPTSTNFHVHAKTKLEHISPKLIQSPQQVATVAVKELLRRKKPLIVTSGLMKVMLFMSRITRRKKMTSMMGNKAKPLYG
jgi:short-subunit dehydrogenase